MRVIPFGAGVYISAGHAISILGFAQPDDPDIVLVESLAGEKQLDQAEEVAMYDAVWEGLSAQAANEKDSVQRIEEMLRYLAP